MYLSMTLFVGGGDSGGALASREFVVSVGNVTGDCEVWVLTGVEVFCVVIREPHTLLLVGVKDFTILSVGATDVAAFVRCLVSMGERALSC